MLTVTTASRYSSNQSADSISDLDSPTSTSPALSTTPLSEDVSQSDHSSQDSSSRIPRPRNSFMIFRCVFSRAHKSTGKRVRRPKGSVKDKSLSKRASEAWQQLCKEEKRRYEELARQEALAHKEKYPDYQFRPMKKSAHRKKPVTNVHPRPAPSVVRPVVGAIVNAPAKAALYQVPRTQNQQSQLPPSQPYGNLGRYLMSSSAPSQYSQLPPLWDDQLLRSALKRSRSSSETTQVTADLFPSDEGPCCDPRVFEPGSSGYCTPDEPPMVVFPDTREPLQLQYPSYADDLQFLPCSTFGASTLSGWDGGQITTPSHWALSQSNAENSCFPHVGFDEGSINLPVYNSPGEPAVPSKSAQDDTSDLKAEPVALTPTLCWNSYDNITQDDHGMAWACFDQNRLATEWPIFGGDGYLDVPYACQA